MGRPSSYTEEIADEICERMANGESLKGICESSDHIPHMATIFRWIGSDLNGFRDKYARGKEAQIEAMAEEIIHIADTCREGVKTKDGKDGIETVTGDMIERSRLQVDARKWLLSKLAPKKYGDRLELAGQVEIVNQAEAILAARRERLKDSTPLPPASE